MAYDARQNRANINIKNSMYCKLPALSSIDELYKTRKKDINKEDMLKSS